MIASQVKGLDANLAESYGYIHDIGRAFGEMKINHIFFGYRFLLGEGYEDAAKICLTHSFPVQDIYQVTGVWDCEKEDYDFLANYLGNIQYTKYDKLIQLCDVIGSANGITIMEKRLVDIVRRYGIDSNNLITRWNKLFELKEEFEKEAGCSLEKILGLRERILLR